MNHHIQSILNAGAHGIVVEIECQLSNGLPSIVIVGLGNKAVDEAKERVRSAFASTGLLLPKKRITINLAPADVPKDSTSFDLPIAAAILQASGQSAPFQPDQALIGEVGLDGSVRPVRGIIGKLLAGKLAGITTFFVPEANVAQATLVPEVNIVAITSIRDLYTEEGQEPSYSIQESRPSIDTTYRHQPSLLNDIAGQAIAKRALEVSAAGGHNILLYGPPGTGKSMLAKSLPGLLPPPSHNEVLEITHLYSLASHNYDALITTRPFRHPHNNSSHTAILGGGIHSKPGEVSLSHRGVLFLDEMPEFSRITLEALRQPLEDKCITISRSRHSVEYPAHFILVATANPCPCGYYGTDKGCSCTAARIVQYQQKISGPILDRIDLHVAVDTVEHRGILRATTTSDTEAAIRQRVSQARAVQYRRYGSTEKTNSGMDNAEIKQFALLDEEALSLLDTAAERLGFSARGYIKAIKIARTIADLEQSKTVKTTHVSEALQYRPSTHKS
jgi:magnesium chelatase family protein